MIPGGEKPEPFIGLAQAPYEGRTLKGWTLGIVIRSTELSEPLDLARRQFEEVEKALPIEAKTNEQISWVESYFHPDKMFDRYSREMKPDLHGSLLWLQWEAGDFDPENARMFVANAAAHGHDDWATWGKLDFQKMANQVSAQLTLGAGDLVSAALEKRAEPGELWRHLYWFARFYSAWRRVKALYAQGQFNTLDKRALQTKAWKRDAWQYMKAQRETRPELSFRTIATNFLFAHPSSVERPEVERYLSTREKLFQPEGAKKKKR